MQPHSDRGRVRPTTPKSGLARALSKLGFCSRSQAWALARAGRVRVNGQVRRDPEWRVVLGQDRLEVDGLPLRAEAKVYVMLNKPRGLVTTRADEQGRATVCDLLAGRGFPFLSPVGRLDKASEGLLLLTNDTAWAARLTDPATHLEKVYHVQVDCLADDELTRRMVVGVKVDGDFLAAKRVAHLRQGTQTSWLEIVLDEGRNRHIRRLLTALGANVLRLVRVSIGGLILGDLPKGEFRQLTSDDLQTLERNEGARTK